MILDVFSVFDSKAGSYCNPFFSSNISTATRAFEYAANDPQQDIGRFPSDFGLYHLGTFNDETCSFDLVQPYLLCLANSFINREER